MLNWRIRNAKDSTVWCRRDGWVEPGFSLESVFTDEEKDGVDSWYGEFPKYDERRELADLLLTKNAEWERTA